MRSVVWTLTPGLRSEEIEAVLARLRDRGLKAETREFPSGLAVVVDEPPEDLAAPPCVARAATVEIPSGAVVTRRALIEAFALGLGAATVGGAAAIAGAFASSAPPSNETPDEVDAASLSELRANGAKRFSFGREPCIVVLQGEKLHAVSLVCTHLGCLVEWTRDGNQLRCPCHRAGFDLEGRVLYGPPPRPLPSYDVVVRGDRVVVRRRARA